MHNFKEMKTILNFPRLQLSVKQLDCVWETENLYCVYV